MARRTRALLALAAAAAAGLAARAQTDGGGSFGPKIALPGVEAAQGAVAGDGTTVYVASHAGQLYQADVKTGNGVWLNRGGDGQTLGDLCLDSREAKTLYGAGRGTGLLYAFTAGGELVRRFVLTDEDKAGGERHYISSCVQSRYYLYVADAYADTLHRFDLPDKGPARGAPPPLADGARDGTAVKLGGDWEPAAGGALGAISLEWSSLWNETGWVLNQDSGKIYTFPLAADGDTAECGRVFVAGGQTEFPGATKMMFDSSNEHILYLAQPGRNAIAVVELDGKRPNRARYIRTITSPLIDGPVGLSEYGEWLLVVNGNLGAKDRSTAVHSLVQVPKHQQQLGADADPDEPFTPVPPGDDPPQKELYDAAAVADVLTAPPRTVDRAPTAPTDESRAPDTVAAPSSDGDVGFGGEPEGNTFDSNSPGTNQDDGKSCFPADALVQVAGGGTRRMDELAVGDLVLAAPGGVYSRVFLFTHRDASASASFVQLHTAAAARPLALTPGHYLYVNGALAAASTARVGDTLLGADGTPARITRITFARARGLYNPQTAAGDVAVDGVIASTYTRAVDPRVAAALLAPARAAAALLGRHWDALVARADLFASGGASWLTACAPRGPPALAG